jgi:hypothetical protein
MMKRRRCAGGEQRLATLRKQQTTVGDVRGKSFVCMTAYNKQTGRFQKHRGGAA